MSASAVPFFTKSAMKRKKESLQVQLCNINYTRNATYLCYAFENMPPITGLWEDEDACPLLGYSTHTSRKVSVIGKEGTAYEINAVVQFSIRAWDTQLLTKES